MEDLINPSSLIGDNELNNRESVSSKEFSDKLKDFKASKNEKEGVELAKLFTRVALQKEIINELEKISSDSYHSKKNDLELLSSLTLITCSKHLQELVSIKNFTLNHFKKALSYYTQVILILQQQEFEYFQEVISRNFTSFLGPLLELIRYAPILKYENNQLLVKLFSILISYGLNTSSKFVEIVEFISSKKDLMRNLFQIEKDSIVIPGPISLFHIFKGADTTNLMDLMNYILPTGVEQFISNICEVLISLSDFNAQSIQQAMIPSLNLALLLPKRSTFHRELISLFVIRQPELITQLSQITYKGFIGVQVRNFLELTGQLQFENQLHESISQHHSKSILYIDNKISQDSSLKIIYESLDQNFKIDYLKELGLIQMISLALDLNITNLKTSSDFLKLYKETQKSTKSIIAVLSSLNYILINNILQDDYFHFKDKVEIPNTFKEMFEFDTIPPISRAILITSKDKDYQCTDLQNFDQILLTITKVSTLTEAILHNQLYSNNPNLSDDHSLGTIYYKMTNKYIDIIVTSIMCSEILIENCYIKLKESEFQWYINITSKKLRNLNSKLLTNLIHLFDSFGAYCIFRFFNNICLNDLKLSEICCGLLVRLLDDSQLKQLVLDSSLCMGVVNQFLELFNDTSLNCFKDLHRHLSLSIDESKEDVISYDSLEYKEILLVLDKLNIKEPEIVNSVSLSQSSSSRNVYSDMNINSVPNFPVPNELETNDMASMASPHLISPVQISLGIFGATSTAKPQQQLQLQRLSKTSSTGDVFPSAGRHTAGSSSMQSYRTAGNLSLPGIPYYAPEGDKTNYLNDENNATIFNLSPEISSSSMGSRVPSFQTAPNYPYDKSQDIANLSHSGTGINIESFNPNYQQNHNYQFPNTSRAQSIHVDDFERFKALSNFHI